MIGSSYLELLRLTAPEIIVALAGFLVLVLDLTFLRRAALAFRFRIAMVAACIGCVLALIVLERGSAQGALPAGMLVVNPLTQLVQMALLVLAILVLLWVGRGAVHHPCGRVLRPDLICHHRDDASGEHAEPVGHLHHH